ncbi:choline dehydrogenase-like flavoprotein [Actinoplanes lutulentus]|uniref:long-chain-alcohol oxidase n=2 Tax=Actinoplanes lutulentus TaxID=1287878 RepID=A0A327Z203_9ACTN|nr:GMC family oxidoreductase [Actinoplanes lutulentus]RAK28790.1 choline dehydrogenase-like flavoprotein [Actinoplanes lutulentus]
MTPEQIRTLHLLCDTVVPSLDRPDDTDGFWARRASDVGTDHAVLAMITAMPAEQQAGLGSLLDALAANGFHDAPEAVLAAVRQASPEAAAGIGALTSLTLLVTYGITDESGHNPFWTRFGYPGPVATEPPADDRKITPLPVTGDLDLEADVVVIGSGAGGGLIAGRLAAGGADVIVLEAGRYRTESDFDQHEIAAYQGSYWRGGPTPTVDGNITLMAGAGLGGGTVINWTNCIRTRDDVRRQWAEHGLTDVATPEFDRHLDAVWRELSVNDRCSEFNRIHEAMRRGSETLGWSFKTVNRNWDEKRHDAAIAGHLGFGDVSGAKQSSLKVYLEPAVLDHNARVVDGCQVEKILVAGGRAAGVTGKVGEYRVNVRAPIVVLAAGALESPGVLLRSGIGGPAVGQYLRLHPCTVTMGDYGTDMRGWWGAPQAALIDEFATIENGHGFLMESIQYAPALGASAVPFTTPAEHKQTMADFRNTGSFIGLIRDRGHGRISLDPAGNSVASYELTDELDVRNTQRALEAEIRLHHAAGAGRIQVLAQGLPAWQAGDNLDAYIAQAQQLHLGAGGATIFSAHQMGSCRMGTDPATSVANPHGELHDTPGVWIGDASAFPTPSGTNPMISIMALASRTATFIGYA